MKTQTFILPLCSLLLSLPAVADVFVLKDGSRLEGTILREEGSNYVLEVKVTKSIRDEKVVAKSDVVTIEKEQKDLGAFEAIKVLVPTPDMMSTEDYSVRILAVTNFLSTYPTSARKAEATKILETLKKESADVAEGGMKINGAIVPAGAYKANAYDIDAEKQAAVVRSSATRLEYTKALRAFDALDADFKDSKSYQNIVPIVNQVLNAYEAQVKAALAALPARESEQKAGLARMSGADRNNAESALAAQKAGALALFKQEKEVDKQNWVTADPTIKPALDDTLRAISTARGKLTSYKPSTTDPGAAYRDARKALASRDAKASTAAVQAARTARLPARYADGLAEEAKVLQTEATAKAAAYKAAADAAAKAEKEAAAAEKAKADAAAKAEAAEKAKNKAPAQ